MRQSARRWIIAIGAVLFLGAGCLGDGDSEDSSRIVEETAGNKDDAPQKPPTLVDPGPQNSELGYMNGDWDVLVDNRVFAHLDLLHTPDMESINGSFVMAEGDVKGDLYQAKWKDDAFSADWFVRSEVGPETLKLNDVKRDQQGVVRGRLMDSRTGRGYDVVLVRKGTIQ